MANRGVESSRAPPGSVSKVENIFFHIYSAIAEKKLKIHMILVHRVLLLEHLGLQVQALE